MKVFLLFLLAFQFAQAEKEAGGGNAVICFDGAEYAQNAQIAGYHSMVLDQETLKHIVSIEALDLAMARNVFFASIPGFTPEFIDISANQSPDDYILKNLIKRFERHLPGLSQIFLDGAKELDFKNIVEVRQVEKLEDHGLLSVIEGGENLYDTQRCILMTVVSQRGSKVTINTDLYFHRKHSRLSQVAFVAHELAWSRGRSFNQPTSRPTQILVSLAMMRAVPLTVENIRNLMLNVGFPVGEVYAYSLVRKTASDWKKRHLSNTFEDRWKIFGELRLSLRGIEGLPSEKSEALIKVFSDWVRAYDYNIDAPEIDPTTVSMNYKIPSHYSQ